MVHEMSRSPGVTGRNGHDSQPVWVWLFSFTAGLTKNSTNEWVTHLALFSVIIDGGTYSHSIPRLMVIRFATRKTVQKLSSVPLLSPQTHEPKGASHREELTVRVPYCSPITFPVCLLLLHHCSLALPSVLLGVYPYHRSINTSWRK